MAGAHRPGRPDAGALRRLGDGHPEPPETAGDPRRRDVHRAHLPHQQVGLRLHRRGRRRRPDRARRQARRAHRHRRERHPGGAAPGTRRPRAVRVPAHALHGGRPGQPADRPRVGGVADPGLAPASPGQLPAARQRGIRRAGPGRRRLDPQRPVAERPAAERRGQRTRPRGTGGVGRARRLPTDERDPCPGGRGGRRSGHGRGAQTLVPLHVQAADVQRHVSGHLQPAERHAGGHRRSRRGGAHHRRRGRGRRPRVRGGLPDLRHRVRGRHLGGALRSAAGVRAGWAHPHRLLRFRAAHAARLLQHALPEPVPPRPDAERQLGQLRAHPGRAGHPRRRGDRRGPRPRRPPGRAERRGGTGLG